MAFLFKVSNKHSAGSGNPPQIDGDTPNQYYGYFQNEYAEQFIFVYDYSINKGMLWAGDLGWEESYEVISGKVPNIDLGENERVWLLTCWQTATTRPE